MGKVIKNDLKENIIASSSVGGSNWRGLIDSKSMEKIQIESTQLRVTKGSSYRAGNVQQLRCPKQ